MTLFHEQAYMSMLMKQFFSLAIEPGQLSYLPNNDGCKIPNMPPKDMCKANKDDELLMAILSERCDELKESTVDLNLAIAWIYGCYSVDKVANSQAKAKLVIEILDI